MTTRQLPAKNDLRDQFESILHQHYAVLSRHAERLLRNRQDAEDATQIAMISAWQHLSGFEGRSSLRTWLHGIVHNAAHRVGMQRTRRREIFAPTGGDLETSYAVAIDDAGSPDVMLERKELRSRIARALRRLLPEQRRVFILAEIRGLDGAAIARRLGVKPVAARVRLHRARKALEEALCAVA